MDASTRISLITGAAAEVVGLEHLEARIAEGGTIRAYVGFEPSGKAHVGWKVLATNLQDRFKHFPNQVQLSKESSGKVNPLVKQV